MSGINSGNVRGVLDSVLSWSRVRSYAGYSKHDALNSPFLWACTVNVGILRLLITQVVMRFPVNIRPLLGVPRGRNPKGIALFAHALLDRACTNIENGDAHIQEADQLLAWLIEHASPQSSATSGLREHWGLEEHECGDRTLQGLGWGYHYPWQDQGFFQPRHYPNRVVTSWIGFSMLRAYEVTHDEKYLRACEEIAIFLTENPRRLYETDEELCLSYVPLEDIDWAVMDVSALVSAFLARFIWNADYFLLRENLPDSYFLQSAPSADQRRCNLAVLAKRLMQFVVSKQTEYGGWFYTYPSKDSHIKHDNYHTAIILDCLADYMFYRNAHEWEPIYRKGLDYYKQALFLSNGAPKWMNDRVFPHDIHGAASGILCFNRAVRYYQDETGKDAQWENAILAWTLKYMYSDKGFFYYQKHRFYRKHFCLMRWGNAWMCRALSQHLLNKVD